MLIVANWKAYQRSIHEAQELFLAISAAMVNDGSVQVAIAAPHLYLGVLQGLRGRDRRVALAAQCSSAFSTGAYTGEITAAMLADIHCRYALVGHSERRVHLNEREASMAAQCRELLEHNIRPVVCVGEHAAQREQGQSEMVVEQQITRMLERLEKDPLWKDNNRHAKLSTLIIAYEPVWAIGAQACERNEAERMHEHIQKIGQKEGFDWPILYGGGVTPQSWKGMLQNKNLSGALVGGASLKAEVFAEIIAQTRAEASTKVKL